VTDEGDRPDAAGSDGPVDPYDVRQVAEVLTATLRVIGTDGLLDLLLRLPGVRLVPGTPARLFRPAVESGLWLGPEHFVSLCPSPDAAVHQHVVAGVVLQRAALSPADLPRVLAGLVTALTRAQDSADETAMVLTAARDVVDRL
jgi:hypothetical protein